MGPCSRTPLEPHLNPLFIYRSGLQAQTRSMSLWRHPLPRAWPWASAALLLLGLALPLAQASEDHERARAALQAGEVLSLQKVLEKIQRSHPGELLEAELEREHGRWVYELKLLQKGGVLMRLEVDAKTGEVLKSRQRSGQGSPQAKPETRKSP